MKKPLEVLHLYPPHDYTLHGAFASRASRDAQRPFIYFGDRTWSWHSFDGGASPRSRGCSSSAGSQRGDRVGVSGRNSDGHVLMLFALARIGAIMVPINPEFGVEEARYVLHHAEVSGVVASAETLDVVREACEGLASAPWFLMLDAAHGGVEGLLDAASRAKRRSAAGGRDGDDTVLIVYTSGTTGFPKGAMHSQKNLRHRRRSVRAARLSPARRPRDDRAAAVPHQRAVLFGRGNAGGGLQHDRRAALLGVDVLADGGANTARPK